MTALATLRTAAPFASTVRPRRLSHAASRSSSSASRASASSEDLAYAQMAHMQVSRPVSPVEAPTRSAALGQCAMP